MLKSGRKAGGPGPGGSLVGKPGKPGSREAGKPGKPEALEAPGSRSREARLPGLKGKLRQGPF